MEDVAESYLNELVERCLIQVAERDATLKIKTCRMHDLIRDICLAKAKQENFLHILDTDSFSASISSRVRRIVVHEFTPVRSIRSKSNLRSILFFCNLVRNEIDQPWTCMFKNFELLRVLGFEDQRANLGGLKLPSTIGNLIQLRYLSLRNMVFVSPNIPSSLGNLMCLQTLDLRVKSSGVYIPNVIWRLEQLRHLYLPHPKDCNSKTKLKLHALTNLQTLVNFSTVHCFIQDLCSLINLRRLEIFFLGLNAKDHFEEVIQSKHIRSLSIQCPNEETADQARNITLLILSSCLTTICELSLEVKIGKLPDNFSNSNYIAYLRLRWCQLEEDPMPTLEKLPNLRILKLEDGAFMRTIMVCSANLFPKLDSLTLRGLDNLEEWEVEEGAMSALRSLNIRFCPRLNLLPEGLKFISTLEELMIERMTDSFKSKLEEGGQDFYKVQHIPIIKFFPKGRDVFDP